jgi:hypothetical protein
VASAIVKADIDAGKFPLKDKDAAMASAFAFLRAKVQRPPPPEPLPPGLLGSAWRAMAFTQG